MRKIVLIYGACLAIVTFALTWLDYKFWMRDIGLEIYGVGIAIIFAGLGIWIERQRRSGKSMPSAEQAKTPLVVEGLTAREQEVLEQLTNGKGNKEIARALNLSPDTVKTHLSNLYRKMGVKNRTQAVAKLAGLPQETSSDKEKQPNHPSG